MPLLEILHLKEKEVSTIIVLKQKLINLIFIQTIPITFTLVKWEEMSCQYGSSSKV